MSQQVGGRTTLQDRVYDAISTDIAQGVLRPGTKLLVAHLAKRFGTSQAPVREALRRLTQEGRAVTIPYVGSVVKEPSWAEIEDIYALRCELEAYAIRRILGGSSTVSLAPVKRALRDLSRAVRSGDEVKVIDADLEFHRQVCELAGSALTVEVWETITQRFRGARLTLLQQYKDDLVTVVPSHEVLVEALESGDSERAQHAFRDHLVSAVTSFAERSGNSSSSSPDTRDVRLSVIRN